jgi:hypothetical protein
MADGIGPPQGPALDLSEKGRARNEEPQSLDRRLFVQLLVFDEDPGYFLSTVRPLLAGDAFSALRFREEFTMLGRTYSMGWEADLEELTEKEQRAVWQAPLG